MTTETPQTAVPRPARNYAHEMRAKIDELAQGTYIPALVAHQIVVKLRAEDPDLLDGWLGAQAEAFVRQSINERDRSRRSAARWATPRSVFREDAGEHERGDSTNLRGWLHVSFSLSNGTRMPLAEMTTTELSDVATTYAVRAEGNAMTAAFLRAIGQRIGAGKVEDYFDDSTLATMWQSLTGS